MSISKQCKVPEIYSIYHGCLYELPQKWINYAFKLSTSAKNALIMQYNLHEIGWAVWERGLTYTIWTKT